MQREESISKKVSERQIVGLRTNYMVVYLQDGQFQGFVEQQGAKVIKRSAIDKGYMVEDFGYMFNVVYTGVHIE